MAEITFEFPDGVERRIHQLSDELGYVTLGEVVSRLKVAPLARVEFSAVALAPYLYDASLGDAFELPELDALTAGDLAGAVTRWIRRTASDNMAGRTESKFKVSLWRPKGDAQLHSFRFIARAPASEAFDEEDDDSGSGIVTPPPNMPPLNNGVFPPDAAAWQALSGSYVNFVSLLQNGYAHLFGLQNNAIIVLTGDNQRLRRTLEDAYGDLAKLRIGTFEIESAQREEAGSAKVREELGTQFISELGSLGRVFASVKLGMPAELVELVDLVNNTPELAEAIRDPEVRKVLRDEKTRKELAALLKLAAQPTPQKEQPQAA